MRSFHPIERNPRDFTPSFRHRIRRFFSKPRTLAVAEVLPEGVDGSHWNFDQFEDWEVVVTLIKFGYFKGTQGTYQVDDQGIELAKNAHDVGIPSVLYLFFDPTLGGSAQASYWVEHTEEYWNYIDATPVCVIDCEVLWGVSPDVFRNRLLACIQELHSEGVKVVVYSNISFANDTKIYLLDGDIDAYIVAYWSSVLDQLPIGWPEEKVMAWQIGIWDNYSWTFPIPGAVPDLDENYLLWDLDVFREWIGQDGAQPPPEGFDWETWRDDVNKTLTNHAVRILNLEGKSVD